MNFYDKKIFFTRIVGIISSLIIVVFAANIDQSLSRNISGDSTPEEKNETEDQDQKTVNATSDYENIDYYRRGGGGGGGGVSRRRNNTASMNTNSAVLFLPIVYFIVAN